MSIEVLKPVSGDTKAAFETAPALETVEGLTIGIISNGKHGTVPFFDALESRLRDEHRVAEVVRVVKPNYSAPAPDEVLDPARHWHALIAGVGD